MFATVMFKLDLLTNAHFTPRPPMIGTTADGRKIPSLKMEERLARAPAPVQTLRLFCDPVLRQTCCLTPPYKRSFFARDFGLLSPTLDYRLSFVAGRDVVL